LPPILDGVVASVCELAADWETRISIPVPCFLFNRIFFDEGIVFDESLANHEDWDCWMQIFAKAAWIGYCSEKLAIYRYHPESMCRDLLKMREGYLQAIDKQLANDALSRETKAILRVKCAEMCLNYDRQLPQKSSVSRRSSSLLSWIARRLIPVRPGS
jgi:hypothetical protein